MIYLYKKTHKVTGLKYLGKTSKKDPYSYPGSGKRWRAHLDKHGYNFDTEILLESEDPAKIKEAGLHYSKIWNIVDDVNWANLKPESGDGGPFRHTAEAKQKISESSRKRGNGRAGKKYEEFLKDPEAVKQKHSQWMLENNPYRGKKHSAETIQKMKESAMGRQQLSDEERKKTWGSLKGKPWSEARRAAQQMKKDKK